MGGEFGQFIEWKDQEQLDWFLLDYESHRRMLAYTASLNKLYLSEKALWELDHDHEGYQWIDADDNEQSVISYIRTGKKPGDTLLIIFNFQPVEHLHYRIGVPRVGTYEEIFSSEDITFGGSGRHNAPQKSSKVEWHNQLNSIELTLPPLSFLVFKKSGRTGKRKQTIEIEE